MNRVAGSRRHLAGLLRRRPILDPVVARPYGAAGQGEDDVPSILERVDTDPADPATEDSTTDNDSIDNDSIDNDSIDHDSIDHIAPLSAPRQQPHVAS